MAKYLSRHRDRIEAIFFQPENIGCKFSVPIAINWFFNKSSADICIVIEDDCLPKKEFFNLIEQHALELCTSKIGILSGTYPIKGLKDFDIQETKYSFIHGWCVGKSSWKEINQKLYSRNLQSKNTSYAERIYWNLTKLKVETGELDTWDAHFTISQLNSGRRNYAANNELIVNIGYDKLATHSKEKNVDLNYLGGSKFESISQTEKDAYIMKHFYKIRSFKIPLWIAKFYWLKITKNREDMQNKFNSLSDKVMKS